MKSVSAAAIAAIIFLLVASAAGGNLSWSSVAGCFVLTYISAVLRWWLGDLR